MSYRFDCTDPSERHHGLAQAQALLRVGELAVVPTEASYGLACDVFSLSGMAALREAKGNRRLAPPVLIGGGRTLDGLAADLSEAARDLVEAFWPGPLTLVCRAGPTFDWRMGDGSSEVVSLRMPLHPVLLRLLSQTGPLAVTGANIPGHRLPTTYDEAHGQLGELVAVYLDAGPTRYGGSSTVVDVRGPVPRILRAGALDVATVREVVPGLLDAEEAKA